MPHTLLERQTLYIRLCKISELNIKLWWVEVRERKKSAFCDPFILPEGIFFNICILSQCIEYWTLLDSLYYYYLLIILFLSPLSLLLLLLLLILSLLSSSLLLPYIIIFTIILSFLFWFMWSILDRRVFAVKNYFKLYIIIKS